MHLCFGIELQDYRFLTAWLLILNGILLYIMWHLPSFSKYSPVNNRCCMIKEK